MALVNTYTSPREIDEARERTPAGSDADPEGLRATAQEGAGATGCPCRAGCCAGQEGQADRRLDQDIADEKAEVDSLKADMDRDQAQIQAIKTKYEEDKKRFLELTQR